MTKQNFFGYQSNLTSTKIIFFEKYIEKYIIKTLMQFGECLLADLFCGPGKNGSKDGSPLILLKKSMKMLESLILIKKHPIPDIEIIFNDKNHNYVKSLKEEIRKIEIPNNIKILGPSCSDFNEILGKIEYRLSKIKKPKFFFLDPFGYVDINIKSIETIMGFPNTEVLLFIPIWSVYRFINSKKMGSNQKRFLEEFTKNGPGPYSNLDELIDSVKQKLEEYLKLEYVRPIIIGEGKNKNSLFFLTTHIKGMMHINNIFWKYTKDSKTINIPKSLLMEKDLKLFEYESMLFQDKFLIILEDYIKKNKIVTNIEIINFTVKNGVKLKFARKCLEHLEEKGVIKVIHNKPDKIRGFYVSESNWNKNLCDIHYILR